MPLLPAPRHGVLTHLWQIAALKGRRVGLFGAATRAAPTIPHATLPARKGGRARADSQKTPRIRQLHAGMRQLHAGMCQLHAGMCQLRAGMCQLHAGIRQLRAGMCQLHAGIRQLHAGMCQLHAGIRQLRAGMRQLQCF